MSFDIRKLAAGLVLALVMSCAALAQDAAASGPQYKDRAEYDLVQAFQKETDPAKQIDLLKQWKDKYPDSAFKEQRYNFMVVTYQKAGNAQGMYDTAKEMAAANPKGFGNYWLTILTTSMAKTDEGFLSTGEQAANGLLSALDDPASGFPADQKTTFQAAAHKTLGWVSMQRKTWDKAEDEFGKVLALQPNDAETSYFLGSSMLQEKKKEKISAAMYYLAHAIGVSGPGALPAPTSKQVDDYLRKTYTAWHGEDPAGYQALLSSAKSSATPPADFHILDKVEIAQKKVDEENQKMKDNPSLAQWNGMRDLLMTPDGAGKFPTEMKGAVVPTKFSGKVVSAEGKTVTLAISDPATPDAKLEFPTPLKCKLEPGTALSFENATPDAFTASPYLLTMKVEPKSVTGLPAGCTGPAAPAHRAPVRRTAAAKK